LPSKEYNLKKLYPKVSKYFDINNKSTNLYNTHKQVFLVKEGDLIIFPSYLKHYVEPNLNKKERISISFNYG